jgi:hypothetical protein
MTHNAVVRCVALGLAVTVGAACITSVQSPPAAGYGAPYRGRGQGIYVLDSQGSSFEIVEGRERISSEQALEAAGDAEYEARRQIALDHNTRLYREALAHAALGNTMIRGGLVGAAVGLALSLVVAPRLATGAREVVSDVGVGIGIAGVVVAAYGYLGGKQPPPYHAWQTPPSLDRPAYVRQQTEPYNQRLGAPLVNPAGAR